MNGDKANEVTSKLGLLNMYHIEDRGFSSSLWAFTKHQMDFISIV